MIYIQRQIDYDLETVGETKDRKEARRLLKEYRKLEPSAEFRLSQRPCKEWANRG
jgi:hypothetical protein